MSGISFQYSDGLALSGSDTTDGQTARSFEVDASSGEISVNTETELYQRSPDAAALTGGGFVVAWEGNDPDADGSFMGISAQLFDANGNKIGSEFVVNSSTYSYQYDPSVVALSSGGFFVSWYSYDESKDGDGTAVIGQFFDASGNKVGSELTINSGSVGDQQIPSVAALGDDSVVVVWETAADGDYFSSSFSFRVFDSSGNPSGNEVTIAPEIDGLRYGDPQVAALSDGGFVISYTFRDTTQDPSTTQVFAQRYNDAGVAQGDAILVVEKDDEGSPQAPTVEGLSDGGFVVSFEYFPNSGGGDDLNLLARIYDANGDAAGDQVAIETGSGKAKEASIVALDDGGFAVTWSGPTGGEFERGILLRLFDGDGVAQSEAVVVNTVNTQSYYGQNEPDLVLLANGSLAVAWETDDESIDPNPYGIGARIFTLSVGQDNPDTPNNSDMASAGPDHIYGTAQGDEIDGGLGADTLEGAGGNDTLLGGGGGDFLRGGTHADKLDGGAGNDVLFGDHGADTLNGGEGTDVLQYLDSGVGVTVNLATGLGAGGQAAGDVIVGVENVRGSRASDHLIGDDLANRFIGYGGWDTLEGGAGDDRLEGWRGHDFIDGGDGNDFILGGMDNDTLTGGAGDDTLGGGAGEDIFIFAAGSGNDKISDFSPSEDILDLSGASAGFSGKSDLEAVVSEEEGGLLIDLGGGDSVLIVGLTLADLANMSIEY